MNKKLVFIAIAILAPMLYVDTVYLAGDAIQHSTVTIKPAYEEAELLDVEIDEPGLPYSISFDLGFGTDKQRAEILLIAPSGQEVLHKVEIEKRSGYRNYYFTPTETGVYQLSLSSLSLAPLTRSSVVTVVKNDRRVLRRFVAYLAI